MSTLAVRLAVSAAVASVVMTGIEALRVRQARPTPRVEAAPELAPDLPVPAPRLSRAVVPLSEEAPAKAPAAPKPQAMARIHGRVLGQDTAELAVTITDGHDQYEAAVDDEGTFQMNLPPGSYTLTANAGDEVGEGQVDDLREDEDREVVLVLAEGVAIEGRIEGCDGPCKDATVSARVAGTESVSSAVSSNAAGGFSLGGLVQGRKYDLVFQEESMRRLVLPAASAPKRDLTVTLEPLATLSGGFGVEHGQKCPMTSATLVRKGEPDLQTGFDRHCNFHFEELSDVGSVHVRATGTGWHFEAEVSIPAHGNPAFLCLRGPCRQSDPEPETRLQVLFTGNPAGQVSLWTASSEGGAGKSCHPSSGPCLLSGLTPEPGVKVTVESDQCEAQTSTVDLQPGTNTLSFHCRPSRRIRGMLRSPGDLGTAPHARVRCSSDHASQVLQDVFFALECPERQSTIEYQLSSHHPWRTVAVPPGDGGSVAFVDIAAN